MTTIWLEIELWMGRTRELEPPEMMRGSLHCYHKVRFIE